MKWVRRGYELGFLFLGRPVRPFHFAVFLATGTVAVTNLFFEGIVLGGDVGDFVGIVAAAASLLLFAGWWGRNDWLAEYGLLLAAGCWASRATFTLLTNERPWPTFMLSFAWVVGAVGAYLLERYDHALSEADD